MIEDADAVRAFLGVSVALGETREAVTAALGDDAAWDAAPGLQASSREVRARALTAVLAQLLADVDAAVLA